MAVADLKIGMYVAELDRPWLESPFLFQGFFIESQEELEKLRNTCAFVHVDEERSAAGPDDACTAKPAAGSTTSTPPAAGDNKSAFTGSIKRLVEVRNVAQHKVLRILEDARLGKSIDAAESRRTVEALVWHLSANPNSMLWLSSLRKEHAQTADHCLNVTILALLLGRHLNLSEEDLTLLGMGAMLHDIGMMRIPSELLEKPGKLTEAEFAIVKRHPLEGFTVLKLAQQVPEAALSVVRSHHERLDGSGYPDKLKGEAVPLMARITAIADAYDAMTGGYTYKRALPPHEALKVLRNECTESYGNDLTQEFMRCLGIYPVGSLVQLNSGSLGLVVASNPEARLRPTLMLVRDEHGNEIRPRTFLNLSQLAEGQDQEKWSIRAVVDPLEHGIDLAALTAEATQL